MGSKSEEYFVCYASDEDIFDEENNGENPRSKNPIDIKQVDADKAKLIRAEKLLAGVPLPPKFTNPQVNLDTAVSLLKKYLSECSSVKNGTSIYMENTILDMYPNRNVYTEKLENVRILIQDWFNSNETSSFMTCTARQLTESAKKKHKKNGWSESPASRAKYLNRRNTVYKALCSSNSSQRTLTLDRKNGLLKSKCDTKVRSKSTGPKRALFQSPDKQPSSSAPCFELNVPSTSSTSSSSTVCNLKTPASSVTRKWESRDEVKRSSSYCSGGQISSEKKKCWRSLQFGNGQNNNESNDQSSSRSTQKLSTLHSRKLLWAIDQVLKGEGLARSDKEFRPLAKGLYKESSVVWLNKFEGQKRIGSTSNTMVEVAKSLFCPVAAQLGIQLKPLMCGRYASVFDVVANCHSSEDSSFTVSPEMVGPSLLEDTDNINLSETVPIYSNSSESICSKLTSEILGQGTQSDSDTTCDNIIEKNINSNVVSSIHNGCDDHSVITTHRLVSENVDISDKSLRENKKTDIMSDSEHLDSSESLETSDLPTNRKKEKRKRGEDTTKDQVSKNESSVKRLCLDDEGPSSNYVNDNSTGGSNLTVEKDKENDSGVENTSELDTQNWSPVIKLRRTSRNNWTSELKKKCLNQKLEKSSPPEGCSFLGIEGPFKYRLSERALKGDYITVILKGTSYLNSYKKLIKRKEITDDSILVRPLEEGLELGIPVILFEREKVFLGPHTVCDLVGDILEDAIFKLDEMDCLKFSNGFPGFSMSEIYSSSVNSFRMTRSIKNNEATGNPVLKPLFTMYKYAIITKSPPDGEQFYQIFVEIPKSSMFLMSRKIDGETILVRSLKSNSPKKIILELNVPVRLVSADHRPVNLSILEDLKNTNNILTLQT